MTQLTYGSHAYLGKKVITKLEINAHYYFDNK
jgi:hypothetical protein